MHVCWIGTNLKRIDMNNTNKWHDLTVKLPNEVIDKLGKHTTEISFTYAYTYAYTVACIIDRHKKISIWALGNTQDSSLSSALQLLDKLDAIESKVKIVVPDLNEQPYNNGYHHVMVDDVHKFSYKRINNKFYLMSINVMSADNFIVLDTPTPMDNSYKFIKTTERGDLYEWGALGFLSGQKGLAYVKDGLVISYKVTHMS